MDEIDEECKLMESQFGKMPYQGAFDSYDELEVTRVLIEARFYLCSSICKCVL